jgi:hypothetical protein
MRVLTLTSLILAGLCGAVDTAQAQQASCKYVANSSGLA